MPILTAAPYSYLLDDLIVVRVSARNAMGWSNVSPLNTVGATAKTVPQAVSTPIRGIETRATKIQTNWTALTTAAETGSSTILSYHLQWDQGTNTWVDLVGHPSNSLLTSYTVSSGVSGGTTYKF